MKYVEVMKQALSAHQALREWIEAVPQDTPLPAMPGCDGDWLDDVESALSEAIAQTEKVEPVAWLQIGIAPFHDGVVIARTAKPKKWNSDWWKFEPLYAAPPAAHSIGVKE